MSCTPQCKHLVFGASEGWGSHICDRSIGPNALGRSNQSPKKKKKKKSAVVDVKRQKA